MSQSTGTPQKIQTLWLYALLVWVSTSCTKSHKVGLYKGGTNPDDLIATFASRHNYELPLENCKIFTDLYKIAYDVQLLCLKMD